MQYIQVYISNLGITETFPESTNLLSIGNLVEDRLGFRPLNARVNNKTRELSFTLYNDAEVEFIGIRDESGIRTYFRSLSFLISKALHDILPSAKLFVEHSLSKGYYCNIKNSHSITAEELERLKQRIDELIKADLPFVPRSLRTEEAVKIFCNMGFDDKAALLETIGDVYTYFHELDGYPNYFYGCLVPSTGYIYLYDIIPWMDGLLIQVPDEKNPSELRHPIPQPMMKDVFHKHDKLLNLTECKYVGYLNRIIDRGEISTMIQVSEAFQEKEISRIANEIAERYAAGVRVILISGPSSSGKTTFCKRLQIQLITNFLRPHGISLDDYFVDRTRTPLDERGEYDYEHLRALDLDFLGEQIRDIIAGKEVLLPTYDFANGMRKFKGNKILLHAGDLLVMEGIHALNPDLLPNIPEEVTYKIYVSALTGISLDAHNRIPSADNRLLRRIVRDHKYRAYSATNTIKRWPSVRAGEEKWVFPYQENANAMFNSAMVYELAALRSLAEQILHAVPRNVEEYAEATRLLHFLSYFHYIPTRLLPNVSLLREFLGGSAFRY